MKSDKCKTVWLPYFLTVIKWVIKSFVGGDSNIKAPPIRLIVGFGRFVGTSLFWCMAFAVCNNNKIEATNEHIHLRLNRTGTNKYHSIHDINPQFRRHLTFGTPKSESVIPMYQTPSLYVVMKWRGKKHQKKRQMKKKSEFSIRLFFLALTCLINFNIVHRAWNFDHIHWKLKMQ